eukprot:gnl/TRDRNA2_/TRDRNA2_186513_c0_seq1.p1 gnl/TRDRNA2_/TRDRNA2_186513_c0~~gnl/TRDRNA2_/TRDRNA2_186513_c0_seq1.p1  ORF type:complete len:334 (+),score=73.39 gnl/TRDRNA2_/TRDRNA2_186513_c0_seq1:91-1002(+)
MAAPDGAVREHRLYETVKMIKEWIEKSFEPAQEMRFQQKGCLKARFDVDLGPEMCQNLEAYIKASFVLKRLQIRFSHKDQQDGKPPRPVLEVLLDEDARSLYEEKHRDAVAKRRQAVAGALEAGQAALTNEGDSSERSNPSASAPTPPAKRPASETESQAPGGTPTPPPAKRPATAAVAGSGDAASVWEAVTPTVVPTGRDGLIEAKDALEAGLHVQAGTLAALRAEKAAVGWLKGLAAAEVSPKDLKETLIGQTVNCWRKHSEPYIAAQAVSLLKTWKAAWRQAETDAKQRGASTAAVNADV